MRLHSLRQVGEALGIQIVLDARWRGGELDRLMNARHSAFHERVARYLSSLPGWVFEPEVSFAIWGERGVIDVLAWHPERRALLVIELKTQLVDIQETVGTLDRKRRLARRVAAQRGWTPRVVAAWLLIADSATNRRRVAAHRAMLRAAFPVDGREMRHWLSDPAGDVRALSFWSEDRANTPTRPIAPRFRVRVPATRLGHEGVGATGGVESASKSR